jgi:hypothetical protein
VTVQDFKAVVDDLLALPFPLEDTRVGNRHSGPGYHMRVLRASRDFWHDRSAETVEAAEEEIDAAFQELVAALTARWGEPEPIDLSPYLRRGLVRRLAVDHGGPQTPPDEDPVPEPIDQLCMLSSTMLLWRRPESGRWAALLVGQQDAEFPIELLAAVGEASIP